MLEGLILQVYVLLVLMLLGLPQRALRAIVLLQTTVQSQA